MVGGIGAADMAHERWTCQPLQDGFAPFDDNIVDSVLSEKPQDLLGDIVGKVGGGGPRSDPQP